MYYNKLKRKVFIENNELDGEFSEKFVEQIREVVNNEDFAEFVVPCDGTKIVLVYNIIGDKTYVLRPTQKEDIDKIEQIRNYVFYLELTKEFDSEIEFIIDD